MTQTAVKAPWSSGDSLEGRTLYIPRMSDEGPALMAAAYRGVGVDGQVLPESSAYSLDLARQFTNGDECYPEQVTLGGIMEVAESPGFDPSRVAFLMPTACGPCRFGQYYVLLKQILAERGLDEVAVVSASSTDNYQGFGEHAGELIRMMWWSLVCGDGLRKLLLQTRPYETTPGETDRVHAECLELLCRAMERQDIDLKERFNGLVEAMAKVGERFSQIPADYRKDRPLIGIVGEIYCRLDTFANADLIRRIERLGGEAWLAGISEWVYFINLKVQLELRESGQRFSKAMLKTILKDKIQHRAEHRLLAPLKKRFKGYEEVHSMKKLVDPAAPYLPYWGAHGEMVISLGGIMHMHHKGIDGAIDISPFSCMNGIVCEAVYPKAAVEMDNMPVRVLYFDGTGGDYDGDVEVFLELASTYRKRKKTKRIYPDHFQS